MSESVEERVEMARALAEGNSDREHQEEFGGELGRLKANRSIDGTSDISDDARAREQKERANV